MLRRLTRKRARKRAASSAVSAYGRIWSRQASSSSPSQRPETSVAAAATTFSTGKIARLASGAVVARTGDSVILATAVSDAGGHDAAERDFMPLSVDFRAKSSGFGFIPGTFLRREMGTSDSDILTSRAIDRVLRPFFPKGWFHESQIVTTLQSFDSAQSDVEVQSINAASAALSISDIPFNGPCAAVRIARRREDRTLVVNPPAAFLNDTAACSGHLLYAGGDDHPVMLEGSFDQWSEADVAEAMRLAQLQLPPLLDAQRELQQRIGREKREFVPRVPTERQRDRAQTLGYERACDVVRSCKGMSKSQRGNAQTEFYTWMRETLVAEAEAEAEAASWSEEELSAAVDKVRLHAAAEGVMKAAIRNLAMDEGVRFDGRRVDEVRPILVDQEVLPVVHGSALFSRGDTQALCTTTLGGLDDDMQLIKGMDADAHRHMNGGNDNSRRRLRKSFFLHYEFPPYSVNETGRIGMPNRRMIGHGALAEKALERMMPHGHSLAYADMLSGKPVKGMLSIGELVDMFDANKTGAHDEDDANAASIDATATNGTDDTAFFPYAIRVTSEVSASDGSSSMATVCGATAALLDAGVPLRAPVAGVSVGLATPAEGTNWTANEKYQLLTDILGTEDHFGDMDFKIAGTREGVTALQLDMKQRGIPIEILAEAMDRANEARGDILSSMHDKMATKAQDRSSATKVRPQVHQRVVFPLEDDGMVRMLVGPKGATIRALESRYPNAHINVISNPNRKGVGAKNPLSTLGQTDECEPAAALVEVSGPSVQSLEECVRAIYGMFAPPKEGQVYMGVVTRVEKYGAFVELPDMSVVLVHKNELEPSSEEMGLDGVVRGAIDANLITAVGEPMELVCMGWDSEHGRIRYVPARVAAELEARKQRENEKTMAEAKDNFGWTASSDDKDEAGKEPEVLSAGSENKENKGVITKSTEGKKEEENEDEQQADHHGKVVEGKKKRKESEGAEVGTHIKNKPSSTRKLGGDFGKGALNRKPEMGQMYVGQVKQVKSYGIWVDIGCNRDGMLHMSDLGDGVTLQSFKPGDTIPVICTKILDGSTVYLGPMDKAQVIAATHAEAQVKAASIEKVEREKRRLKRKERRIRQRKAKEAARQVIQQAKEAARQVIPPANQSQQSSKKPAGQRGQANESKNRGGKRLSHEKTSRVRGISQDGFRFRTSINGIRRKRIRVSAKSQEGQKEASGLLNRVKSFFGI